MPHFYAYTPHNRGADIFSDAKRSRRLDNGRERFYPAGRIIVYQAERALDDDDLIDRFLTDRERNDYRWPTRVTRRDAERAFGRSDLMAIIENYDFYEDIGEPFSG